MEIDFSLRNKFDHNGRMKVTKYHETNRKITRINNIKM